MMSKLISDIEILTSEKSEISSVAWRHFMRLFEAGTPVMEEEGALLLNAMSQQEEAVRDQAFFEVGFRFAMLCVEEGYLGPVGKNLSN
jgi:hypothetical protein